MRHFKTIADYCKAIQIPAPKHPHFDIRRFEDNMKTVVHEMTPSRLTINSIIMIKRKKR